MTYGRLGKREILEGPMYPLIFKMAIPIIINNIIQTLYNLADGMFVSMISSEHFAATSFVWPVNYLFISIGAGLAIAGTSIISNILGSGDQKKAKEYAAQLISITFILSLVFTLIGYYFTPNIISMMGAVGNFYEYSVIYLRITFLNIPFMFYFLNVNSIMSAQGDTITPTILAAITAILNIVLDPIFIFTFNQGIAGAAYATLISWAVLAVISYIFLMRNERLIKPDFEDFKFDNAKIKHILEIAIPSSIGQSGTAIGFIVLNVFIRSYGTAILASFSAVNRITSLITQATMGIGAALTAIVGQNLGAKKIDRALEAFKKSLIIAITIGLVGGVLMAIFNKGVINFYIRSKDNMEVIYEARKYLLYTCAVLPFLASFTVFQGLFQGSGKTKYSMIMDISRLWAIRIPLILILGKFTNLGSEGIWISMNISNVVICGYGYIIYKSNLWLDEEMEFV